LEVLSGGKLDPQITIYEPAASWFDPRAVRRLAFNDEPDTASKNLNPSLTYRFDRKGPFLATVGAFLGRGGPDCSYQLRIVPAAQRGIPMTTPKLAHKLDGGWEEHSFARELGLDRLTALAARTAISTETMSPGRPESKVANVALTAVSGAPEVDRPGAKPATHVVPVAEGEPNRALNQAREISLPALIEGTIDRPGGVDHFRFRVNDGTRLAFEIETPAKPAPFFAPRLAVFDQRGQEVLNNIYAFVQGSGEFIEKVVEPKVISNFEQGGEYLLEVRDLTFRSGGPDFRYRVLIRPQIPHVSRIDVAFSLGRSLDGFFKGTRLSI
jgi:hypothetical protein